MKQSIISDHTVSLQRARTRPSVMAPRKLAVSGLRGRVDPAVRRDGSLVCETSTLMRSRFTFGDFFGLD
jgi:hypothetical protein